MKATSSSRDRPPVLSQGWSLTLTIAFYGLALVVAVGVAFSFQQRGESVFLSLFFGAFAGTMSSYFLFRACYLCLRWFRR